MRSALVFAFFVTAVTAQQKYKFCAPESISDADCNALQRGESRVLCLRVTDSADCAIRLARGEADFGLYTTEELLLAYQFYPSDILPIYELRHKTRRNEKFEFQAVAVVPTSLTPVGPGRGFRSLRNGGICHPGFSDSQWWNDYILKHFERTVITVNKTTNYVCKEDLTAAENEAENLKGFFGQACRPGEWVADSSIDAELKKKYPELCALCDDRAKCKYNRWENHGHTGALECLKAGRGVVAYVALNHVRQYLDSNSSFQFLCPDGSVQPLSRENPCAWIKQPWNVIAAGKNRAAQLAIEMKSWFAIPYAAESWTVALTKVLLDESIPMALPENPSLGKYLGEGRELTISAAHSCGRSIRWCTIGDLETNKCNWVAKEALALGIEPTLSCNKANSTFQCFRDIAANRADIITIDSNYGYLARSVYNLSTVLYSETNQDKYSVVVAVTREAEKFNIPDPSPVKSFKELKGRTVCFPEYGGIAWLSFVNIARDMGLISSKRCDYPALVSKFLSGACTPGVRDTDHSNDTVHLEVLKEDVTSVLCKTCRSKRPDASCDADERNIYYGDKGAMECLSDGAGDMAFIEARNLIDGTIDPNMYRILCRNSSLAQHSGFHIDEQCALSVTIDSEIVSRKNNSKVMLTDITLALLKMENWLGYRVNSPRPIHVYDKFNNTMDLLFKDSTSGLVPTTSTIKSVLAYKELFQHVERCSSAAVTIFSNLTLVTLVLLSSVLFFGGL